jgi:Protein of unknown function (DUF4238)
MPLDHYVSQVHLRNFCSPTLGNRLHAIRKSDLKQFSPRPADVCRIKDGSSNAYLKSERIIEEFLRDIEPRYNASVSKLRQDKIDREAICALAGFAAYVSCCAPAAMRIHAVPLKSTLESTAFILDSRGAFPKAPEELGGKSISELLADGSVHFTVDEKYPQALGISAIIQLLSILGNSQWEILHSAETTSPFFTSDFPVAIEARGNSGIVNRIVPLTPELAVRIMPDVELSRAKPDLSFPAFCYRQRKVGHADVSALNRLIVRCAEDTVFYRDNHKWIGAFIAKNRAYRIETVITRLPYGSEGRGIMEIASQCVLPRRDAA